MGRFWCVPSLGGIREIGSGPSSAIWQAKVLPKSQPFCLPLTGLPRRSWTAYGTSSSGTVPVRPPTQASPASHGPWPGWPPSWSMRCPAVPLSAFLLNTSTLQKSGHKPDRAGPSCPCPFPRRMRIGRWNNACRSRTGMLRSSTVTWAHGTYCLLRIGNCWSSTLGRPGWATLTSTWPPCWGDW